MPTPVLHFRHHAASKCTFATGKDGSVTYKNPLYGEFANLRLKGIPEHPNSLKRNKVRVLERLIPKRLRSSAAIVQKQLRIPVDAVAKYAQQGPAWGTQEWADIYRRGRNTIESRNALVKNHNQALGDKTRRLVRGFAANFMVIALGTVSVNVNLINTFLRNLASPNRKLKKPVIAEPCQRIGSRTFIDDETDANAPPTSGEPLVA